MGYRSEVYLGIDSDIIEELLTFVGVNQEVYQLLFEHTKYAKKTQRGGIHFYWDWVKWYGENPSIRKLVNFLKENDGKYKFLRIGEQYDDIEEEGYSEQYYFEVQRSVELHFE